MEPDTQQQGGEAYGDPRLQIVDYPQKKLVLLCDALFDLLADCDAASGRTLSKSYDNMVIYFNNVFLRTSGIFTEEERVKYKPDISEASPIMIDKAKEYLKMLQKKGIYPLGSEEAKL